jgi:hypothetical protein
MNSEKELESVLGSAGFEMETASVDDVQASQGAVQESGIPEGVVADFDFSEPAVEEGAQASAEPTQQTEEVTADVPSEPAQSSLNTETQEPSTPTINDDIVAQYLSETLGVELQSIEALKDMMVPKEAEIDERVKVIADFVSETGRSPEDWFKYQSINPSEMDDMTAVKLSMINDYPDLSGEEIDMLVGSKYKLDEDLYTDDEIKLSKLQLKIDANKSRQQIEELRSSYTLPLENNDSTDVSSPIDEQWISSMKRETEALEALTFELPGGEFNFGITDEYKNQLVSKNANIESFFDQYVDSNGQWDYDKFNTHQALVDNIDAIAKSLYQQGLSDGQRKIVEQAANVSTQSPGVAQAQPQDDLAKQIIDALGADKTLRFL